MKGWIQYPIIFTLMGISFSQIYPHLTNEIICNNEKDFFVNLTVLFLQGILLVFL
jgi:hypothetical protein